MAVQHGVQSNPFLSELFDLSGKVAVVTGAGSGIGHAIARYFAAAGAAVVIADRNASHGERVAAELREDGRESVAIETDVSDETSVQTLITKTVAHFGALDVLVNDAGIFPFMPIAQMTLAAWEGVQDVNLRGTFLCTREAALRMRAQGRGGRIINISSIDALHPSSVGLAHYDASKGGVNMFTRSAALEFGHDGITVNAILPGSIATEGAAEASKGSDLDLGTFGRRIVLGRTGTPDDVAGAALFLASKAASYVTGQFLIVDGGFLIG